MTAASAPSGPAASGAVATNTANTATAVPPAPAGVTAATSPARALVTIAPQVRRGEPFEVRMLVAHPMETGHRADAQGQRVPRDILRRIECRLDGELVFAADLHPAIAANPYIAFPLVAQADGTLVVTWTGDRGFAHSVSVAVRPQ